MAWRDALTGVPWDTFLRRAGIVFAAAQVINAVRGVGIKRSIRRKLRRAKRAAAKRKRVKQANKADAQEKKQATVNRKADAKAKANEKKKNNTKRQFNNVKSNANANSVAYTRDGPVDNTWLAGEYSETAPIELEKEIAAAALDEVAMALAAEGDSAASAAVASMAVRVAKSESPKKIRLDALANIGSTLSSNLSSNQLVSNTLSGANSPFSFHSAANSEFEAEHGTGNQSKQSNQSFGKSRLGNLTRYDGEISARNRSTSGSQSSPVLSLTQSPESVADAAFEMASKALEMGDDERGLTSDEEAGKIEFLGRKRRQAAREAMDAELERKRLANEASVAMVNPVLYGDFLLFNEIAEAQNSGGGSDLVRLYEDLTDYGTIKPVLNEDVNQQVLTVEVQHSLTWESPDLWRSPCVLHTSTMNSLARVEANSDQAR